MNGKYNISWSDYGKEFDKNGGYAVSKAPDVDIFKNSLFGKDPIEFQPGRILLPILFDFGKWFWDTWEMVFDPNAYKSKKPDSKDAPPPGAPLAPVASMPAYAMRPAYA